MLSVLEILTNPCVGFLKRCRVFCLSADKSNQNIRNFPKKIKKSGITYLFCLAECPNHGKKRHRCVKPIPPSPKSIPMAAVTKMPKTRGWKGFRCHGGGRMIRPKPFGTPKVSWRHISGNTFPTGFDWGNAVPRQFP